ncbi:zinc finger domain-containing protein [Arenicellales bacterium nBUS_45]
MGNYLRSEILFAAQVNPALRPRDLELRQVNELARTTLILSTQSYKTGGITNHPSTVKVLRKKGFSKSRYRFAVFGRAGKPCYRCGGKISRISANGRRLYVCEGCQG